MIEEDYNIFEQKHVHNIYNNIASNFDKTRSYYWNGVKEFIKNINYEKNKITFLDLGCGNGRYLPLCNNFDTYAVDNCENLLEIVKNKYPFVKIQKCDVCTVPYESEYFDNIISVAVIHHLSSIERRAKMIDEIYRLLKVNGTAFISAWSVDCINNKFKKISENNDYLIPWKNDDLRYYYLFEEFDFEKIIEKTNYRNKIIIIKKFFEHNNWIIIIKKIQ